MNLSLEDARALVTSALEAAGASSLMAASTARALVLAEQVLGLPVDQAVEALVRVDTSRAEAGGHHRRPPVSSTAPQ